MHALIQGQWTPAEEAAIRARVLPLVRAEGLRFNAAGMTRAVEIVREVVGRDETRNLAS